MESRNAPRPDADVRCNTEKVYRGKVRDETMYVWVEETDAAKTGDASTCRVSTRELFSYAIEPEDGWLDPDWMPNDKLYEAGARELALVMLSDALGANDGRARHQSFLYEVVNRLPNEWSMTTEQIRTFLEVGIVPPCVD